MTARRRGARAARPALLLLAAVFALAAPAAALAATTERISVATGGAQANAGSNGASMSADGRFVAFSSDASNLVGGDTSGTWDVFVRDRMTKTTERISGAAPGAWAGEPSISANGRYVAFVSAQTVGQAGLTRFAVFVHDRGTGRTERVSVASDGQPANHWSDQPSISGDGRYVAFHSTASNLVIGDSYGQDDVYVHDRWTGATERVSDASDGTRANGGSAYYDRQLWISTDGRYVAFDSSASNLVAGDTNDVDDVFVHDRVNGVTERVSVSGNGTQGNSGAGAGVSLSDDGRYVLFTSSASNLVAGDTNARDDVFVYDRQTGATERVNPDSARSQDYPTLSGDGRYVAFLSYASDLVAADTNGNPDIFIYDRQTGATERVSVAPDGTQANSTSYPWPAINADGRYVAFASAASNLVAGDTNGVADVFVRDRGATVERLSLDSHDADPTARMTDPVRTANPLTAGRWYVAEVSGTYSSFRPEIMSARWTPWRICGATVSTPAGPTGQDAATIFAWPTKTGVCPRLPLRGKLVVRTGDPATSGFVRPLPAGAFGTHPSHRYRFFLRGQGFRAAFAIRDGFLPDNYGSLTIIVHPALAPPAPAP